MKKTILISSVIIITGILLFPLFGNADFGPKGSWEVNLNYKTINPVIVNDACERFCTDPDCTNSEWECMNDSDSYSELRENVIGKKTSYYTRGGHGNPEKKYYQFRLDINNKTITSQIIEWKQYQTTESHANDPLSLNYGIDETFHVSLCANIFQDDIELIPQCSVRSFPFIMDFYTALLFTLLIELFAAFIFLKLAKSKEKIKFLLLFGVLNILSISLFWFVIPRFFSAYWIIILVGEIFVWLFEWTILVLLFRKKIRWVGIVVTVTIANLLSWAIGHFFL